MKVSILWESKNKQGGGFSFAEALSYGLQKNDHQLTNWQDADICLIPSASVITKELYREVKSADKRIILRIDGALKHSRNRGSGMNRMKEFAEGASEVVFQGTWARDYLSPFLDRKGVIIHNGIDLDLFNPEGEKETFDGDPVYAYSCLSKGETKQWEWAWWEYQMIHRENPKALLVIIGDVPREVREWDFNFFMGERVVDLGIIRDRVQMAKILRGVDYLIASYINDAYSQTYCESLCSGVELYNPNLSGGTKEMLGIWDGKGRDYFSIDRCVKDYIDLFEKII